LQEILDGRPVDVVLSDMAPNATGHRGTDHERIIRMAFKVFEFTKKNGQVGTSLVVKVWQGALLDKFVSLLKDDFEEVKYLKPKSSREESAEIFVAALNLLPKEKVDET
jgi:23S rRNA (uridine2552-2'-O)-methyltransferase